ncbi:MAG: porin [Pseudomonadota bacterium]
MKKMIFAGVGMGISVASAMAQSNVAQSNVTVYGLLDAAVVVAGGGPKGASTRLDSGVSNGSRIGFTGREGLGNGLSSFFTLESGILIDTGASDQGGLLFGRQAFVGLTHAAGTLKIGRQYTLMFDTLTDVDPFTNNYGGAAGQLMAGEKAGTRMNNTVQYTSPAVRGFSAQLAYGFGEVPGDSARSRQFEYGASYNAGPLLLRATYNRTDNAGATDSARNVLLIAKYSFGPLTASAGYGANQGTGSTDSRDYLVAVSAPFGAHGISGTFIHKSDRANTRLGANQVAAAYTYALSKRTNVFVAYSKLSNIRFTTSKFGDGDRELDLGIKHRF